MRTIVGGSRSLAFIPNEALELLSSWMRENYEFLVGDASGTDHKFQQLLGSKTYPLVSVFHSAAGARNNLGGWELVFVDSGLKSSGHAMHSAKDRVMTELADTGLMIWDTRSPGTIANVIDLLKQGKSCHLYVAGNDANLYTVNSLEDLGPLEELHQEAFQEAHRRLLSHQKRSRRTKAPSEDMLF